MCVVERFASQRKLMFKSMQRLIWLFYAAIVCIVASGCERRAGAVIDARKITLGSMEFLAVRNSVKYYAPEIARSYWCRSIATKYGSKPTVDSDAFWDARPNVDDNADYRYFGTIGETASSASVLPVFSEIRSVHPLSAYSTANLVITFDACLTRTYFNISPHARLSDAMLGLPINFPDTNINTAPPFFDSLETFEGGGCLRIDANYVNAAQTYFYCSTDNGKNWTVESPRGTRVVPSATEVERDRVRREQGKKIVWCLQTKDGREAHVRKSECVKQ